MIKTLVVVAALTSGFGGYAVAQQAPPAPAAHHLPTIIPCATFRPIIPSATYRPTILSAVTRRLRGTRHRLGRPHLPWAEAQRRKADAPALHLARQLTPTLTKQRGVALKNGAA